MKLLNFLRDNHSLTKRYHSQSFIEKTVLCRDARSKIIILFIHALNASNAGGNLDNKGLAIEKIIEVTANLVGDKLTFSSFTKAVTGKPYNEPSKESVDALFHTLINNYRQVGHKKAALFLRDLLYTGAEDIFTDVSSNKIWPLLIVPVDKVIADLLGRYYKKDMKNDEWNDYLIKECGDDHMYYEDLWFWGHFGTKVSKKGRSVERGSNEAMFLMDTIMTTMPERYVANVKEQIKKFAGIFLNK